MLDNKACIYGGHTSFENFPNHTGPSICPSIPLSSSSPLAIGSNRWCKTTN